MTEETSNTDKAARELAKMDWKDLLKDSRVIAIVIIAITMSASVTTQIEKATGLKFNKSEDSMSQDCVRRALYGAEFSDSERLTAAKVCVPKKT